MSIQDSALYIELFDSSTIIVVMVDEIELFVIHEPNRHPGVRVDQLVIDDGIQDILPCQSETLADRAIALAMELMGRTDIEQAIRLDLDTVHNYRTSV